jgi:outer membrane protein assembly factor BamB
MVDAFDYTNIGNTSQAFALDTADGSVLWSEDLGAELGAGVSVVGGAVYAPHGFWFFGSPAKPVGGVIAFRTDT